MKKLVEIYIETAIALEEFKQCCDCDVENQISDLNIELSSNKDYYKEKYHLNDIVDRHGSTRFCCFIEKGVLEF